MEKLLHDTYLIKLLDKVDVDLADAVGSRECKYCGGKLHCGDYPRKPRGVSCWTKRYSFNCSVCRKRHTPASVRFLGRKVYAGFVLVLVSAIENRASTKEIGRLCDTLGIDVRTLKRWARWWQEVFACSAFWKGVRGRFVRPLGQGALAHDLVAVFAAHTCEGMVRLLKFLSPITVCFGLEGCAM